MVFAKVLINKGLDSISCMIIKAADPSFAEPVCSSIYKSQSKILDIVDNEDELFFYIPFKFEVIQKHIIQDMKQHGIIRIMKFHLFDYELVYQ